MLKILCDSSEYDELPVRHNEDVYNKTLSEQVLWPVDQYSYDSPHSKTNLLLQAHFSHMKFWIPDYITDLKSVLDQSIRILQAIIDVSADSGWLWTTFKTIELLQMIMQGQWSETSSLCQLPSFGPKTVDLFNKRGFNYLPELLAIRREDLARTIEGLLTKHQQQEFWKVYDILPVINVSYSLSGNGEYNQGEEVEITVNLHRLGKIPTEGANTPKFPKRKEEGWYLILGDPATGELYALKRINCLKKNTSYKLGFDMPDTSGEYEFCLYLMSDVYLGLDQQYIIKFEVSSGDDEV